MVREDLGIGGLEDSRTWGLDFFLAKANSLALCVMKFTVYVSLNLSGDMEHWCGAVSSTARLSFTMSALALYAPKHSVTVFHPSRNQDIS